MAKGSKKPKSKKGAKKPAKKKPHKADIGKENP